MLKSIYLFILLNFSLFILSAQTTDLSIAIEAQNLDGNAISQINIYEDFQYLITISNNGNAVNNASILIDFDDDLSLISSTSQNSVNGASDVTNIDDIDNVLTASIANMPNNSSIELLVIVTAPTNLGGIAANGTVSPPTSTTDTNTSNNQSIISIDVLDIVIDFSVTHTQIQPTAGTPINAWGDEVTYQFTITNNSTIDFPVDIISGNLNLASPFDNGQPFVEFISLECLGATNGTQCPDTTDVTSTSIAVQTTETIFDFNTETEVTSDGSITFEVVYRYSNFSCSPNPMPIDVDSLIQISLSHSNVSSNNSNSVTTNLLNADLCPETDICIETVQIDPDISSSLGYEQDITLETTVCNNGPSAAPIRFFLQNLSPLTWNIISINCLGTTGPVTCNDFTISDNGQIWVSNDFTLQPNTTITIETIVEYLEPSCSTTQNNITALIRSATNILDSELIDTNLDNNNFSNFLEFPPAEPCDASNQSDLQVTKTQVSPTLPIGESQQSTAEWGLVTYEITVINVSEDVAIIELQDHMPVPPSGATPINATLTSVECVGTTGTASCFTIENSYIGEIFDGITEDGSFDTFWEILPEDNWELPANSSVTFSVTLDWQPECSENSIIGTNVVRVNYANNLVDISPINNIAEVNTYFAPCIDLVVQTYPEFVSVDTNQTFNWIVDVSNSTTSSTATNTIFENTLNSAFSITGAVTCSVVSGNAICALSFATNGNFISGIIPSMEAGSTVRITIPVTAPSFGGAFNNVAEASPSAADNEELTPETNISINSVQVVSPVLEKSFFPDTIFEGAESELTFTVFNIANNPTQSSISFTDNLPSGVTIAAMPNWIQDNGCTANFIGNTGDDFVGISDLIFPDGVESCTFSVIVTSDIAGIYINNFENFTNTNNINTSQTIASLNVIIDNSNVDIEVLKTVEPMEVILGDEVTFTITATNLGSDVGTQIEIIDQLPSGYEFTSHSTTLGSFDESTFIWSIMSLFPDESGTLNITARAISSSDLLNVAVLNSLNEIDRDQSNDEGNAFVEISNCLIIPQGISPNNDTKNDFLIIPCIEDYPDNSFKIYNRYGTQVYQAKNYRNTWDGESNMGFPNHSGLLPIGTYFYILEIKGFNKPLQGYIYLNY
ncbi:gliding motility-associated C-terminal domain-containing protein [Winogradskyella sp. PE311]|uniref:DUF7933 domain-containing protein n=1 Tax=Winogradskyella sp. PE311 TaxID=3366943 RepID=UPI00397EE387